MHDSAEALRAPVYFSAIIYYSYFTGNLLLTLHAYCIVMLHVSYIYNILYTHSGQDAGMPLGHHGPLLVHSGVCVLVLVQGCGYRG